jgi:hypothetical protein
MRNPPNTRLLAATPAVLALAYLIAARAPAVAQAPPHIPATFYGTLTVDGRPAPAGTMVRAFIDGKDCTQSDVRGSIMDGDAARYVVTVVHETHTEGCGHEGAEVSFTVAGLPAPQKGAWTAGPVQVDLAVGPLPSPSPGLSPSPTRSQAAAGLVSGEEAAPGGGAIRIVLLAIAAAVAAAGVALFAGRKLKGKG